MDGKRKEAGETDGDGNRTRESATLVGAIFQIPASLLVLLRFILVYFAPPPSLSLSHSGSNLVISLFLWLLLRCGFIVFIPFGSFS